MSPRKLQQQKNLNLGLTGEEQARVFLQAKNFQIRECRYRVGQDEIDLIAFDQRHQEIVFIEVKTRTSDDLLDPEEAWTRRKLQALQRAAQHYLAKQTALAFDYRFDLVTVLPQEIRHFENLTWP
jgi:putative endonuclease